MNFNYGFTGNSLRDHKSVGKRWKLSLRGVLFADLFELLVPVGPAVVHLLPEPGDHIGVLIRVDRYVGDLRGTKEAHG